MYLLAQRFYWQTGRRTAHELRKIGGAARPRTKRERNGQSDTTHEAEACSLEAEACSAKGY